MECDYVGVCLRKSLANLVLQGDTYIYIHIFVCIYIYVYIKIYMCVCVYIYIYRCFLAVCQMKGIVLVNEWGSTD